MVIPLKAGLNIQQNAAWYFSKAAKSRTAMTVMQERHLRLLHELETMRVRLHSLCSMTSAEELETLENGLHGKARKPAQQGPDGNRKTPQFRTVELARGITLYIGKNAANNDVLTFQHSRPDDIWLHARGASGSHCVIKGATLQNTAEIRRAAEIAAWYSSARPSALVPVIYTLRKYVRKAKNSSPGSVIVEREKVIMVKPLKE